MKKFWKILIITVLTLGILAVTCPGRQRHLDGLVEFMSYSLHKQANEVTKSYEKQHNKSMPDQGKQALAGLQETLISQMRPAINSVLVVKNYVLFSVGHFVNETDGALRVSVGVLGMVFVQNKDEFNVNLNI